MRREATNMTVIAIGVLLLLAALWFAWTSSRPTGDFGLAPVVGGLGFDGETVAFNWQAEGAQVYEARCASCHGAGERTPRVPPLQGHVPNLFLADGGRDYLIDFLLFGFEGTMEVGGDEFRSRHPVYKDRLSDVQIAAVLNHMLISWNNQQRLPERFSFYQPEEVARHRHQNFTAEQISKMREAIRLSL